MVGLTFNACTPAVGGLCYAPNAIEGVAGEVFLAGRDDATSVCVLSTRRSFGGVVCTDVRSLLMMLCIHRHCAGFVTN